MARPAPLSSRCLTNLAGLLLAFSVACGRSGLELAAVGVDAGAAEGPGSRDPPAPRRVSFRLAPAVLLDVDARNDGAFLVLHEYIPPRGSAGELEVRGRLFSGWAEPLGDAFVVYATRDFSPSGEAAFLADGSIVVAFPIADGGPFELDYAVRVRRYDAAGLPVAGTVLEYADEWRPLVVGLAGGGFALGTQRWYGEASATPLRLRVYDSAGRQRGEARAMEAGCLRLTAGPAGGFDVTCDDGSAVVVRRFDGEGVLVAVLPALQPIAPGVGIEALVYGPDDGLVVAGQGHVRRLDAAGMPVGPWRDFRWTDDDAVPWQTTLAPGGCGAVPCRYTAFWLDPAPSVRPRARVLGVSGAPLPGREVALAPAVDPVAGGRLWYTNIDAAGSRDFGQSVLAWTANDRADGEVVSSIEGVLVVE